MKDPLRIGDGKLSSDCRFKTMWKCSRSLSGLMLWNGGESVDIQSSYDRFPRQVRNYPQTLPTAVESLLLVLGQSEPDRALRTWRRGDQLAQRLEDRVQLLVVSAELRLSLVLEILKAPLDRDNLLRRAAVQ